MVRNAFVNNGEVQVVARPCDMSWESRTLKLARQALGDRRHPRGAGGEGGHKVAPFNSSKKYTQLVNVATQNFAHTYRNT